MGSGCRKVYNVDLQRHSLKLSLTETRAAHWVIVGLVFGTHVALAGFVRLYQAVEATWLGARSTGWSKEGPNCGGILCFVAKTSEYEK